MTRERVDEIAHDYLEGGIAADDAVNELYGKRPPIVIEIDPTAKYAIVLHQHTSLEDMEYLRGKLKAWWGNPDEKFCVLRGNIQLQRVSE